MNNYYDNLLSQIQVNLSVARLTLCPSYWGEEDITLDHCKIYYFLDGEGKLVINGDTYYPKPGEMYLLPSGVRHSYSHNPQKPVYKYWCHFYMKFGEISKFIYDKSCVCCKPDMEYATALFEKLCHLDSASGVERIMQKSCLLELCYMYFSSVPVERILFVQKDDFYAVISRYISDNLTEKITVDELSHIAHLQPNYFVSKFKKSFGTTPIEYINSLRLEGAARELTQSRDGSIEDIARRYGFDDYRYFGRLFRRRYGSSPREFRKV